MGKKDKPKGPPPISTQSEIAVLMAAMENDSDQALAIVGGAIVEEFLARAIRSRLIEDSSTVEKIFGIKGFINTFSAKIDFGYVSGYYNNIMLSDLNVMRDVRNKFAHNTNLQRITDGFKDTEISHLCKSLIIIDHYVANKSTEAALAPFKSVSTRQYRPTPEEVNSYPIEYRYHSLSASREAIVSNMRWRYQWSVIALCSYLHLLIINPRRPAFDASLH